MAPGDRWKFQLGLESKVWQGAVDHLGEPVFYDSPAVSNAWNFGLAHALDSAWSVSLILPLQQNAHPEAGQDVALADPTVTLRWFGLEQDVDRGLPEVHIHTSLKAPYARSTSESERDHLLDVHGNGFYEWMNGMDAWYSSMHWRAGFSAVLVSRQASDTIQKQSAVPRDYGATLKTEASLTHLWHGRGEVGLSLQKEEKYRDRARGSWVKDSDMLVHRYGLNAQMRIAALRTLGFSYTGAIPDLPKKNIRRSESFSISLSQVI